MKEYIVSTDTEYEFEMHRFEELQELIRCKDCKHYEIWEMRKDGNADDKRYKPSVCTIGAYAIHRDEGWFCADAERKENETD